MQAVGLLRELGYTNVAHYAGGLTEWFAGAAPSEATAPSAPPARRTASADSLVTWPSRFVMSLADRSVRDLFYIWVGIVIVWGIVYWLMARLPGGALVRNGEMLPADAGGWLSAVYFSAVTATSV